MDLDPSVPHCCGTRFYEFRLLPVRSPLLGESSRIAAGFFSFPPATKMFQFAGCPSVILCVRIADVPSSTEQVSLFGDPRIKGCLPPNRGLSQAAASFVGFLCQGIHHILLTWFSHIFGLMIFHEMKMRPYPEIANERDKDFFWFYIKLLKSGVTNFL
jgi:hypothetical protein